MEVKHTPGPWSFDLVCFDRKIPIRGGVTAYGRPYIISHVNRPGSAFSGQDKANAALIAAAPDLLEACRYIVEAGENGDEMTAIEKARAAISKASPLTKTEGE